MTLAICLKPATFRPAAIEAITGIDPNELRVMRHRGFEVSGGQGWLAATPFILAKLMLMQALRKCGFQLAEAWAKAFDEVVRNIVCRAAIMPGAIVDDTDVDYLASKPDELIKFATDLSGERWHAAGDFYIFADGLPGSVFATIDEAIKEAKRNGEPPIVMTVVDLREISRRMVERAGRLATIVDRDDD